MRVGPWLLQLLLRLCSQSPCAQVACAQEAAQIVWAPAALPIGILLWMLEEYRPHRFPAAVEEVQKVRLETGLRVPVLQQPARAVRGQAREAAQEKAPG